MGYSDQDDEARAADRAAEVSCQPNPGDTEPGQQPLVSLRRLHRRSAVALSGQDDTATDA